MKNRVHDYLSDSKPTGQPSRPAFQELRELARKQFADRVRQAETYVREHPVAGISAAFCIGVFLGWIIKRR